MDDAKINVSALIAEQKILAAMREGQFDNLPGSGRPQKLEDLSHLPEDLRLAYIALKNSGFLEEDGGRRRVPDLRELMARCEGSEIDSGRLERLKFLLNRSGKSQQRQDLDDRVDNVVTHSYLEKLLERI